MYLATTFLPGIRGGTAVQEEEILEILEYYLDR